MHCLIHFVFLIYLESSFSLNFCILFFLFLGTGPYALHLIKSGMLPIYFRHKLCSPMNNNLLVISFIFSQSLNPCKSWMSSFFILIFNNFIFFINENSAKSRKNVLLFSVRRTFKYRYSSIFFT